MVQTESSSHIPWLWSGPGWTWSFDNIPETSTLTPASPVVTSACPGVLWCVGAWLVVVVEGSRCGGGVVLW